MSVDLLEPQIRELFTTLDHAGELDPAEGASVATGEAGREELGTRVRIALRIADGRVQAVRYRAYGCPHTLATCEWLARTLEGRRPDALEIGNPLDWARQLDVPAAKLGRLLVVEDALQAALTRS
ncbi:MAG TPA: iron-sulfur cluster assembly scaffold protein [Steroidobacteraceae bacterium]|jgi:NifU-like protein involved in Fe-S cluster formation|nr:iron-sulfur cluster assembly scaffold protein [Steroidobacteraceae bacterium]